MAKNFTIKLKDSEPNVYTTAIIGYKNLMLSKNIDDSIASNLLEKVQDNKLKLSPLELKHLIKAVQIHRNNSLVKQNNTSTIDCFLKKLLEINNRERER